MGIPSYFSFIVKNHTNIVKKLHTLNKNINNFYLDSNSIIYDSLRAIENTFDGDNDKFESVLLENICDKINEYILTIKPNKRVFIAFDGVAPVAKLEQQRTRRYKSYLLKFLKNELLEQNEVWDKTAITPGTKFMKKLGNYINDYYKNQEKKYNIEKFIISTSDEPGEGEHKLFQYIRENKKAHSQETTIVYGLDADLIMLALNHLHISRHIYLYRETPEFIKSLHADLEPNAPYFLNIPELGQIIRADMNGYSQISKKQENNRLYDYILLCFFLGNDFMPHFPSVNIRTGGIHIMLSAYKNLFGKKNINLTDGHTIFWNNIKHLVKYLADSEHRNLLDQYNIRQKWEKRHYASSTLDEKMVKLDNLPSKNRSVEYFIDPENDGWEKRYYKILFNIDINNYWKKKICINYLEGLEWTMKYYTSECVDWNWSYKYHYPPLWKDLVNYIPSWETSMIEQNNYLPIDPKVQLAYVLPQPSLKLLPMEFHKKLLDEMIEYYPLDCKIHWAFCKYFWEAHPDLPSIDLNKLKSIYQNTI